MPTVIEAIFFGFRAILDYQLIKRALLIGLGVILAWIFFGYLIWDPLIAITQFFINLVPFAMLRYNGAWIVSSFLWFSLVLITFSLIVTFFGNMILERVSKKQFSTISLLIVFASALFWLFIWFTEGALIHQQIVKMLNWFPFETVKETLADLMAVYILYSGIVVTMLFITSFFSQQILEYVREKYFPDEFFLEENKIKATENRLRDILIYAVISILAFPILFIPIINIVFLLGLWIWLIKDTFINDSAKLVIPKEKRGELAKHKWGLYVISGIAALFNFLPLFNIFGPFFGEIASFYYLSNLKKL
ncbi:EI24 domain-containing protein [Galenea microaerophila]